MDLVSISAIEAQGSLSVLSVQCKRKWRKDWVIGGCNSLKYAPESSRSNMSIKLSSSLVSPSLAAERRQREREFQKLVEKKTAMEHFCGGMQFSSVVFPLDQKLKINLSPRITYDPNSFWTGKTILGFFSTTWDNTYLKPYKTPGAWWIQRGSLR